LEDAVFVDVEAPDTHTHLLDVFGRSTIVALGHADLDISTVTSQDRCFTRLIAGWAYDQVHDGRPSFAGIRYISRVDPGWECWAAFVGRAPYLKAKELAIAKEMAELQAAAKKLGLTVH
jgi:hypothetical protein